VVDLLNVFRRPGNVAVERVEMDNCPDAVPEDERLEKESKLRMGCDCKGVVLGLYLCPLLSLAVV
jgi:hypothetical protein